MRAPSRLALAVGAAVTIVALGVGVGIVAAACLHDPPSPTTTVTSDDGEQVVLDWADYPADPTSDPADVLAATRADDVEEVGDTELGALHAAVEPVAPRLDWTSPGGVLVDDSGGNGYGGASYHQVFNSPSLDGTGFDEAAGWHAIASAVDAELSALGYEPIAWDCDREPYPYETRTQRDERIIAEFGSLDPDEMWHLSGTAMRSSMWASVSIWDERRPTTPEGAWPESESGVGLFVGGTIVAEADEEAYAEGVAPFEGLMRPEPTSSD